MKINLLIIAVLIIMAGWIIYLSFYKEPVQPIVIKNNLEELEKNIKEIDHKLDSLEMIREKIKEKVIVVKTKEKDKKNEVNYVNDNDSLINICRSELLAD